MKQYQTFIFDSCALDAEAGNIELRYSLDGDVFFTETLLLPGDYQLQAPSPEQDKAIAALHLIGGISYYKTCLPKNIKINDSATSLPTGERPTCPERSRGGEGDIRRRTLTQEQADFWNTVYTKGLGEFFFKNHIDFRNLVNFTSHESQVMSHESAAQGLKTQDSQLKTHNSRLLVPIGGGKDSTVTAELLRKAGYDVTLFRIGKHPLIEQAAKIAGLPLLTVERHLAPELFKLNAEGALNGHVPITAYLSFLSVVIAELYGFHAIVMSNERSANEGNTGYLGEQINHQWSKSLEFERTMREYLHGIGTNVEYFSLLRPLSELSIVRIFAGLPQYFSCVTSCNVNWKLKTQDSRLKTRWCCRCPKCAFAFAMFAAFLPKKTLQEIFGKNLFDEESLQPFFRQLLGLEGFKPFECVGTPEETTAAFLLAEERGDLNDSKAMQVFKKEVKPTIKDGKKLIEKCFRPSSDHCVPDSFLSLIPDIPISNP